MRLNLTASVNSDLNLAAIALLGKNDVNAIQAWASDDTDDMGNVSLQLQPGSPENVDGTIAVAKISIACSDFLRSSVE